MANIKKRKKNANTTENAMASNGRRHRKRRKKNNTILYVLLMIFVLGAGIYLTFNVFFKVESFSISGSDKYSTNQVIQATQVQIGDNLFRIDTDEVSDQITSALPYIESAKVSRKLPSVLQIELTEAKVIGAVKTGENYCLISHGGKVLETGATEPPAGAAVVCGLDLVSPEVGNYITEGEDTTRIQILNQLIASLTEQGMAEDVTLIDLSDTFDLYFVYRDAIKVELGSKMEIPYKISFIKKVLEQENIENQEGLIDASGAVDQENPNVRFRAGDFNTIMGETTSVLTQEESPEESTDSTEKEDSSSTTTPATDSEGQSQDLQENQNSEDNSSEETTKE